METSTTARNSLFGLVRALTSDTRTLLRQEVQLAKAELSEKLSKMGRNAVTLAIGGFVAYAGLIVFLVGLGWLLAWAFAQAGLQPVFAAFLGLGVIGLVVVAIGCVMLFKAVKTLKQEPLAPQRTIHTLQELKGARQPAPPEQAQKPSSAEMQTRVEATESRMGEALDELGYRLSPQHINAQVKGRIRENPYRAGLIAAGAGLLSGLLVRRKLSRA